MFMMMEFLFPLFSLAFFILFGVILFRSVKEWNQNNHSPRLTVDVTVVGRRQHRTHNSTNHMGHTHYYITFQVESGDRMELAIPSSQFGYIIEGDRGRLTFQGTRFISFERA